MSFNVCLLCKFHKHGAMAPLSSSCCWPFYPTSWDSHVEVVEFLMPKRSSFIQRLCHICVFLPNIDIEKVQAHILSCLCHNGSMVSWYQKAWFLIRSLISFRKVFYSILMHCNFDKLLPLGHIASISMFLVTSFKSFCSPLWKVATSSMSIFGSSIHFGLLACLTWALSYKAFSILFFMFLVNTISIL